MAIIAAFRFTIYDVYDNAANGCDYHVVWDNDFRFDQTLSNLGFITCLDFEQTCTTCLTGTSNGWILMWDLGEQYLLKKFKAVDPRCQTAKVNVNMIRTHTENKFCYSYDESTQALWMHTLHIKSRMEDKMSTMFSSKLK